MTNNPTAAAAAVGAPGDARAIALSVGSSISLQRAGIAAERVPLSGSAGGKYAGDLSIPVFGIDRRCECKARGKGFGQLYTWLHDRDLLIVRADRREPLVIVPLRLAIEIAVAAERGRRV